MRHRVLFVDDEPSIRLTLPAILSMHGFDVTSAGTVAEGIDAITRQKFDVLIADLNIGQPGDGFTVVSAMRRTQPNAVTIIITGFPAFETALEAIRSQVDDYVVKPADIGRLVHMIEDRLQHRTPHEPPPLKRVADLLRENRKAILERWLAQVKTDPDVVTVSLPDKDLVDHVPRLVDELIYTLQIAPGKISEEAIRSAADHGRARRLQGYSIPMIITEERLLRRSVLTTIEQNLLGLNLSYLLPDLMLVDNSLDVLLKISVEAYLQGSVEPRAA